MRYVNTRVLLVVLWVACGFATSVIAADGIRGGRLYDKWWTENGSATPQGDHSLYPEVGVQSGDVTFRCKECHGWDYKGRDGAYAAGSHFTDIIGVFGSTKTAEEMFNIIKNPNGDGTGGTTVNGHGFGELGLSDGDIEDLVDFLQTKLVDTDVYIEGSDFKGDSQQGADAYQIGPCQVCHGAKGQNINFGAANDPEWLGTLAQGNPWELLHKILFGHPASSPEMPSWLDRQRSVQSAVDLGRYIQTGDFPATIDTTVPNPIRGGHLYDKWWSVNGAATPQGDHPLYPEVGVQTGDVTFRCKECHGWDYKGRDGAYAAGSHFTDIIGVFGSTKTRQEMFDIIKNANGDGAGGTTVNGHGFGAMGLTDEDINDLVEFLQTGVIDTNDYIDGTTFKGDPDKGFVNYANIASCDACHGTTGQRINFGEPDDPEWVGTVGIGNPWEFLHKVRFGHPSADFPDSQMPSFLQIGGTDQDSADVGAWVQASGIFPEGPDPDGRGDIIRGGRLYDKWWTENGSPTPQGDHPLYPEVGVQAGDVTFRCKECHGWDYKGRDGAYAAGSHFTDIIGVFGSTKTAEEMAAIIKNPNGDGTGGTTVNGHGFGALGLGDGDINDLVEFLQSGLVDTNDFIDGKTFKGDANLGFVGYVGPGRCVSCHGADGTAINFDEPESPEWLGTLAVDNPWEFLHKVRVGHPASVPHMQSLLEIGGSDQGAADIGLYVQTGDFPTELPAEGVGPFLRGDCQQDGAVNITDGVFLLNFLFAGQGDIVCRAACDVNASGKFDIASPIYLFNFLFQGGAPPPPPYPEAGVSELETDVEHGCDQPSA